MRSDILWNSCEPWFIDINQSLSGVIVTVYLHLLLNLFPVSLHVYSRKVKNSLLKSMVDTTRMILM